jgi:hypothetical protein
VRGRRSWCGCRGGCGSRRVRRNRRDGAGAAREARRPRPVVLEERRSVNDRRLQEAAASERGASARCEATAVGKGGRASCGDWDDVEGMRVDGRLMSHRSGQSLLAESGRPLFNSEAVRVTLRIAANNSAGSTGLVTCMWKPLSSRRTVSCTRP